MSFMIREAQPEDSEQLLANMRQMLAEPNLNIPLAPDEFQVTVEEERKIVADYAASENSIYLVAEADGQIIGELTCKGGHRRATLHNTFLGMSVCKEWRGKGVGSALMTYAIQWAQQTHRIRRIELYVYAQNDHARHLYEKFGFKIEGRRQQIIYQNGVYLDDFVMALLLPPT